MPEVEEEPLPEVGPVAVPLSQWAAEAEAAAMRLLKEALHFLSLLPAGAEEPGVATRVVRLVELAERAEEPPGFKEAPVQPLVEEAERSQRAAQVDLRAPEEPARMAV